jgi:hypothetical protein
MEFWEENKTAIVGCGTAALVLLFAHIFFLGPMWRRVNTVTEENEKKAKEIASYYPEGGVTVQNLKSTFQLSNAKLKKEYEGLVRKMTLKLEGAFIVPEKEPDPGFYLRRLLTEKRYEMLFYTSTRGMDSIDKSLGFGENVPPDEAVPEMLIELASACEVVRAAADAGVKTVSKISHKGVGKRGAPGYAPFVQERGIGLSMRCSLDALVRFLHSLDKRKYFFGLKNMEIESPLGEEKGLLAVRMECATFRFVEPEEPIKKRKKKVVGPGPRRAPTYGL